MAMCAAQEAARLHKTPQQDSVQPGGLDVGNWLSFDLHQGNLTD